jgi:hypothetical protein
MKIHKSVEILQKINKHILPEINVKEGEVDDDDSDEIVATQDDRRKKTQKVVMLMRNCR